MSPNGENQTPTASPGSVQAQPAGKSYKGMAIAGFVLSFLFSILGLIFSAIALSGMKKSGNLDGKGLATAGLILSIIFIAIAVLYYIAAVALVTSAT